MKARVYILPLVLSLGACAPHYACGVPDGESCLSLAQVYRQIVTTDGQTQPQITTSRPALVKHGRMRVWIAPWTDDEGNSHSAMLVELDGYESLADYDTWSDYAR